MSDHHPCDLASGARTADASQPVEPQQKNQPRLNGLGYFIMFLAAVVFLASNAKILLAMNSAVTTQKRQQEEARRPAQVEVATVTASSCTSCYSLASITESLSSNKNVKIIKANAVDVASAEGAALVKQYNLTRAPALLISGQTEKLLKVLPALGAFGQIQSGKFVGKAPAPYLELATGKIRGEFQVTYLTEKQCAACYDPTINRQSLLRLGLKPTNEKIIDRADPEGLKLVTQYKLTSSPTIIMTGDLAAYEGFDQVWKSVGTIETDGAYVFRSGQTLMGTYYDLTAKKIIEPKAASANTNTAQ